MDFDATSTTVGLAPGGELHRLPRAAVDAPSPDTTRNSEAARWTADVVGIPPYESFASQGSLVRLGWRNRAAGGARLAFKDKRPPEWNQWPEVYGATHGFRASSATCRMVGWRRPSSAPCLDLFAYEDEQETGATLVIGAGIRDEWLREGDGVRVRACRAIWADRLSKRVPSATRSSSHSIRIRMPAAGVVVRNPNDLPARRIMVDGREASPDVNGDLVLLAPAREVRFEY